MIRFVLAWFGYVKVPKEAIILTLRLEEQWAQWLEHPRITDSKNYRLLLEAHTRSIQAIREFLVTGRMTQR